MPVDSVFQKLVDGFVKTVEECQSKDSLTESEKAAFCYLAGVPFEFEQTDLSEVGVTLKMHTSVPCSVDKINGKWTVTQAIGSRNTPQSRMEEQRIKEGK